MAPTTKPPASAEHGDADQENRDGQERLHPRTPPPVDRVASSGPVRPIAVRRIVLRKAPPPRWRDGTLCRLHWDASRRGRRRTRHSAVLPRMCGAGPRFPRNLRTLRRVTSRDDLPTQYTPADVEGRLYQRWIDGGRFTPAATPCAPAYSIVIPPPNVTGSLHVGHALDQSIQDALVRRQRMRGVRHCGCRGWTTRASPRRTSSSASSPRRDCPGTTSAVRRSSEIDRGRETARERCRRRRSRAIRDCEGEGYPGNDYDFVTFFDCLHDMGDPVGRRNTCAAR